MTEKLYGIVDHTNRESRQRDKDFLLPRICNDLLDNRFDRIELENKGLSPYVVNSIAVYFYREACMKANLSLDTVKDAIKLHSLKVDDRFAKKYNCVSVACLFG